MRISYLFKINNTNNNKPSDYLLLMIDNKTKLVVDWRLCPLGGKVLNIKHPIASGKNAIHDANFTSFDLMQGGGKFATLELKRSVILLSSENDIGYFTQKDIAVERNAIYINKTFFDEQTLQPRTVFVA